MRKEELIQKIEELGKAAFTIKDVEKLFPEDAYIKSSLKRFKDAGVVTAVARGFYALKKESLDIEKIATQIYYPSYISFESALSKYGIINQGLYGLTLATTKHSKKIALAGVMCEYSQLKESLFFGFNLSGDTYIAEPEKAFLDMLYLIVLGKRSRNYEEWYLDSLNKSKVKDYIKPFNKGVKALARDLISGI